MYPNNQQVALFNRCLGASRFFFNAANSFLKDHGVKGFLKLETLRPRVMQADDSLPPGHMMEWQKDVPYDTRQEAIGDCITAYKAALTNMRNGNISSFDVGFRRKHGATSQAFRVNKRALDGSNLHIFKRRLGKRGKLRMSKRDARKFLNREEGAVGDVDANLVILKTRPDMWYICLPRKRPDPPVYTTPAYQSVFLDPGVRTFQSWYSPDGVCGKIGGNLHGELKTLASRVDALCSAISNVQEFRAGRVRMRGARSGWTRTPVPYKGTASRTKRNLRARCARVRATIKNKVDDLHAQTCHFLCCNFQSIFLPEFRVSKMVQGSPLGSKVTRAMLQLSHGKFRERLLQYGAARGRDIHIVTEEYTSKTCGRCGRLHETLGSDKVFRCPSAACSLEVDRDLGAARNICLKVMTRCLS